MRNPRSVVLALLLAFAACSPTTGPDPIAVSGTWGGDHAELTAGPASATLEFDCAHGALPVPLTLNNGTFDVAGDFFRERGGPIREDETLTRQPARYSGAVNGTTMSLRVRLTDPPQDLGTYALTFGTSGRLFKCL
jgi:hypothetical protein